jgi:trigger factor
VLTCTVPAADYAPQVKSQLRKIQQQASIKGFRPGKVPQQMIDRMYEKGAIHDAVVKILDQDLNAYLNDSGMKYLGQPLPLSDNFNPTTTKAAVDFEFKYEIGLFPTFKMMGADEAFSVVRHEIAVTDEMLDTEVDTIRKRYGQRGDVDTATMESVLSVRLTELNADGSVREGGAQKEEVKFLMEKLSPASQAAFLGKNVADTVNINIFEVENDSTEARAKSWILGVGEEVEINPTFQAVVTEIKDMVPAAMDDSFFEKIFGEEREINDEAGLRQRFTDMIQGDFAGVSTQMVLNQIYDNLVNVNKFDIPEAFMRKWMKFNDEKITDEKLDAEWDNMCKDIRWSIMKSYLMEKAEVRITQQEMYNSFYAEVARYFGNYAGGEQMVHTTVERMMKNEEAVEKRFQEILSERVLLYVANNVTTVTKTVSKAEFEAIIKENDKKGKEAEMLEEALT